MSRRNYDSPNEISTALLDSRLYFYLANKSRPHRECVAEFQLQRKYISDIEGLGTALVSRGRGDLGRLLLSAICLGEPTARQPPLEWLERAEKYCIRAAVQVQSSRADVPLSLRLL